MTDSYPATESKNASIDPNARNGSVPNCMNWKKIIAIKYKFLITMVVIKNVAAWLKLKWQKYVSNQRKR